MTSFMSLPISIGFFMTLVTPTTLAASHDQVPGAPQKTPIALVGGTLHPVSGPPIENGVIVFDEGKITFVGTEADIPSNAERLDVSGSHVYPGLFESNSQMGLVEISSVRATRDFRETGNFNPNVQAQVAVNPDSEVIPVTRSNGVLLALSTPSGGVVSGQSAILQLDGWTYEDLTLKPAVAMHLNWPRMSPVVNFRTPQSAREQNALRDEALTELREYFETARDYHRAREAAPSEHPIDLKLEAMRSLFTGDMPIFISADEIQQIHAAVAFCGDFGLRAILFGGYDAPLCAELLKRHDIPVIVSSVYRRPRRRDDDYDSAYTLPARLREAGIRYCISGSSTWNARNLPYHAGRAVAYGLPAEEALRAITLSPAEIFGVADRVGSLEVGKDATLFVCSGDPLLTETQVTAAFIQGRKVELNDRHKRLYRKYQEKYRQQGE